MASRTDPRSPTTPARKLPRISLLPLLAVGTALVYYFANWERHSPFDYTMRFAQSMLQGRLGLGQPPPPWLNEMIPHHGYYYSSFPLGAVLCMIPAAVLRVAGMITTFPSAAIVAVQAGVAVVFLFRLTSLYDDKIGRRLLLASFPLFGTWVLCNLAYGGAWQIALGFALLGQAGALYFVLVDRRPLIAGLFFAIAYGNRTEVILTAPVFLYFLLRPTGATPSGCGQIAHAIKLREAPRSSAIFRLGAAERVAYVIKTQAPAALRFLIIPFLLGTCTLAYNYARFGAMTDFGNARIPGVLMEPWYRHGIFSLGAIPANASAMLFQGWKRVPQYPYVTPGGFGGSIFLSCPLLLLLFRTRGGARDQAIKWGSWTAIVLLTLLLWTHGNTGGWQYSYRYATVLLPWMFMILLESGPPGWPWIENVLFGISVAISAWATYLFLWTPYVQP